MIIHLKLSWSVSRGRDTYGYNICRLDDTTTGQRFRCSGGGYDMVGTVFAQWLTANHQEKLLTIKDRANYSFPVDGPMVSGNNPDSLYGLSHHQKDDRMHVDGACGIDCVIRIAEAIGMTVEREYITKGRKRGQTIGWYVE